MISEDLWPQTLDLAPVNLPVTILRSQAAALGKKTNNVVLGLVRKISSSKTSFVYEFVLNAPILDNYTFLLFAIEFELIKQYPVRIFGAEMINLYKDITTEIVMESSVQDQLDSVISCDSEDDFKKVLRAILSHPRILNIIKALYSQSQS